MASVETDILYLGCLTGSGGDAIQMGELAAGIASRGMRVRIVAPESEATRQFADRYCSRDVIVDRTAWLRASGIGTRQRLPDMLRLLRCFRAPLLHIHTGDICPPRSLLLAMELLHRRKAYATIHSAYCHIQRKSARGRFWAVFASKRLVAVVCPSRHGCDVQLRLGVEHKRIRHIPNCIDVRGFANGDGKKPREELGLSPENPLIVFTSRMDAQKHPLDSLVAFREIASEFPDAHLVFVGAGELLEDTRRIAQSMDVVSRVHFPGYRNNIPDWLAAATVWTLPTEAENFSLSVLEAMAAGCPIASTLCTGNDEVLADGENALIHDIGGAGLANAYRRLLADADLRRSLGAAARRTVQEYDLPRMIDDYANLYQ